MVHYVLGALMCALMLSAWVWAKMRLFNQSLRDAIIDSIGFIITYIVVDYILTTYIICPGAF